MSDTPDAGRASSTGERPATPRQPKPAAKPPARPVSEVRADLVKERAALGSSLEDLRADLDEAVDEGRRRAAEIGRKARVIAPAAGAALALALFLRSRARSRR